MYVGGKDEKLREGGEEGREEMEVVYGFCLG